MPAFTRFSAFTTQLNEKKHNLTSDTLKFMLTNNAPDSAWDTKSDVTGELSTGNGYTAGGVAMSGKSTSTTDGVYSLTCTDPSWTASGGTIGPFRYCILYNDSATNDELIAYIDFGYSVTLANGQTWTIDLPSSGVYYSS